MQKSFKNFWDKKWKTPGVSRAIGENLFSHEVLKYKDSGKLLDLGAGIGRDSEFFMKKGFEVNAFDFSKIALNKMKDLEITKICGDVISYDFGENIYDIIYSSNSLHYFYLEDFKKIIKKLFKSLKKGGYIFMRVKSKNDIKFGKGELLEENYYKNGEDLKYYFSLEVLIECFSDFEIIKINEKNDFHFKIKKEKEIHSFIDLIARK